MWNRTKRLINSYLDNLIDRAERPAEEMRDITRAELSRLNELEVSHRANAKVLEKQIAEIDLKMAGIAEREKILQSRGQARPASTVVRELDALNEQRAMLAKALAEANSAAERAKSLRTERTGSGEELATQTYLTKMQENLTDIHSTFGATEPGAVIDEMRSRIAKRGRVTSEAESRAAEADHELARDAKRASVEDMLSQYKQGLGSPLSPTVSRPVGASSTPINEQPAPQSAGSETDTDKNEAETKTLGRADGPIRPID